MVHVFWWRNQVGVGVVKSCTTKYNRNDEKLENKSYKFHILNLDYSCRQQRLETTARLQPGSGSRNSRDAGWTHRLKLEALHRHFAPWWALLVGRRVHAPFFQALCGETAQLVPRQSFWKLHLDCLPSPLFDFTPARSFSSPTASALRGVQVPASRRLPPGPPTLPPPGWPGGLTQRRRFSNGLVQGRSGRCPSPGTPRPPSRPRAGAGGASGGQGAGRGEGARPGVAASSAACPSLEARTCLRAFLQRLHPASRASSSRRPRRRAPGGCLGGPGRGPAASAACSARLGPARPG
ncbi:uncharacterized protein LOC141580466, partial [Saimiri boliviensis]|uniref:uncharacterized protein LOC141580466 n=1 Tax=Saimiri boliviensis TaxID=27679 RepID=UPI003D76A6F8